MSDLKDEIAKNFAVFTEAAAKDMVGNQKILSDNPVFLQSYTRIAAVNALRNLISGEMGVEPNRFLLEAQNDALMSHVLASFGSWRAALQSLRSLIESGLTSLYYKDHPIEHELWLLGDHRVGFTALSRYFEAHPSLRGLPSTITGLMSIEEEYATLSKAVHGSAVNFWMTADSANIALWNTDQAKAGMWATRQRQALRGLCSLIVCLFSGKLIGAQNSGPRQTVGLLFSGQIRKEFQRVLHINLEAI